MSKQSVTLPFPKNKAEKYAQIRFVQNVCVDPTVDYFQGNINLSPDEIGGVGIDFQGNVRK